MQFFSDFAAGPRHRPCAAPAVTGSIIGADPRELRDLWLHELPSHRWHTQSAVQDHRARSRTGLARAIDVEIRIRELWTEIHRAALLRKASGVPPISYCLIQRACNGRADHQSD